MRLELPFEFKYPSRSRFPMPIVDRLVEESEKLVVLALGNRIEFMVVTLRAADGQSQEGRPGGVHPIEHRLDPELFRIDAALLVDLCVAVEPSRYSLRNGGIRKQVAGELLDDKFVERQVAVQGFHHPIAVLPHRTRRVNAVPV